MAGALQRVIADGLLVYTCCGTPEPMSVQLLGKSAIRSLGEDVAIRESQPRRAASIDINLPHAHHGIKRTLCFCASGCQCFGQHARRDLPGDAPLVLAPAALALLATIADNGVPVAVGLLLIVGGDLERKSFTVL